MLSKSNFIHKLGAVQGLEQTRLASSLSGRHSPNALTKVVIFFLGSALARASIIGLRGLEKKRIICRIEIAGISNTTEMPPTPVKCLWAYYFL